MEGSGAALYARTARQVYEAGLDRESWRDHRWRIMGKGSRRRSVLPESSVLTMLRPLPLSRLAATLAAVVLCACAARPPLGENVPPPHFVVGDRWEYRITDGLRRGATTRLDEQVVAMNAGVATMHLAFVDSYGRSQQTEEIDADGGLRAGALRNNEVRRFSPSLKLLSLPIGRRGSWRQVVDTFRRDTQLKDNIGKYGEVPDRASVTVGAGTYEVLAIYRLE